jgi:hypothetical protein
VLGGQPSGEFVLHVEDGRSGDMREELRYEEDKNTSRILAPSEKNMEKVIGEENRKEIRGVLAILSCKRATSRATIPTLLCDTAGSWMYSNPARTLCRTPISCRKAVTTPGFMGVQGRPALTLHK